MSGPAGDARLYTQREVAEALSITTRVLSLRAQNGRPRAGEAPWPIADRVAVRGGYAIRHAYASLPADVRQALDALEAKRRHARALDAVREMVAERREQDLAASIDRKSGEERAKVESEVAARSRALREGRLRFNALKPDSPKRRSALAREWCVLGAVRFREEHGGTWMNAMFGFAEALNAGAVDVPPEVLAELPARNGRRVSEGTIRTWHAAYTKGGIWALTDRYGNREGEGKIETNKDLLQLLLGALQKWPNVTPRKFKDWLQAEHSALNVVSYGTIRRFFNKFKADNPQLWTYLCNPDRWKNIFLVAAGKSDEDIIRLNQRWELDSTPGDWLLKDGRHTVLGCIDVYSRRLKFYVSKTSTAMAVKQLLRRALLDWGVPESVRTDNGKDYVSQELDSLLHDLNVQHQVCLPFASEQKPFIERAFRTMSHGVFELLPGFIGHSVADRKEIESRQSFAARVMKEGEVIEAELTAGELQTLLDDWAEHLYAEAQHSGLKGQTPREVARNWREPVDRIENERALDQLLAEIGDTRTVSKKGIKFDGRLFVDEEGAFFQYIGREVLIRLDEQDMGRIAVYAIGKTQEFLFWAIDIDTLGISRAEYATAARAKQRKFMAAQAAEMREFGKLIKSDPARTVIEHRKSLAQNVVDIQPASTPYTTPALLEAAKAAAARDSMDAGMSPSGGASPAQRAAVAEIKQLSQRESRPKDIRDVDPTPLSQYAYWCHLAECVGAGEELTGEDKVFHEHFPKTLTYKSAKSDFEYFKEDPAARLPKWVVRAKKKAG